jgi:hypothetical protein
MIRCMAYEARPGRLASMAVRARTIDVEGTLVKCFEMADGTRIWLCECAEFQERAARHPEGLCAHTAVGITRCIEDGSIEVRF